MWRVLGCLLLLASASQTKPLKISVYYETLCVDSIRFVKKQLFPVYKLLGNDLLIDLVPYGKASWRNESGKLEFQCQHGPKECYGNMIHACAIAQNSVEESTDFACCSLSSTEGSPASDAVLEECSNSSDISWKALKKCYDSGQADSLLLINDKRTSEVSPPITFIPTIIFNDQYDQTKQSNAQKNLLAVVCELLKYEPEVCRDNTLSGIEVVEL